MDFGLLASDNNGAAFSLDSGDSSKQKSYGFGFLKQDRAANEEDLREFKMTKTMSSSCGEGVLRYPQQRSNGCSLSSEGHQQMLSFSSPNSQPTPLQPYFHYTSNPFGRNTGINGGSMRGPFTPSQWMELEHQALIYKHITANVPIPTYLLNPIRKAFESAGFSTLRSNALGWGGFHLGFSNTDPEPGRCRRTDGKKWRCSRDAVVDQKYCERHMNRGRHRSRKPVEGQTGPTPTPLPPLSNTLSAIPTITRSVVDNNNKAYQQSNTTTVASPKASAHKHQTALQESDRHEFGLVCSDSLLNPLHRSSSSLKYGGSSSSDQKSQHALRQFMDEWPKNPSERSAISWPDLQLDRTQLSISIPVGASDFMSSTSSPTNDKLTASPPRLSRELDMGLGVGSISDDRNHRQTSWVPITWEPTSIGGPLGEVLHNTSGNNMGDSSHAKQLNLIDRWDNSPRLGMASSPTGVLQRGAFVSLSNSSAASSPRAEGSSHCNGVINPSSLPAL